MTFADDIIVFGETSQLNMTNICMVLDLFFKGSGQKINVDKSIIIAPRNVHRLFQRVFHDYNVVFSL